MDPEIIASQGRHASEDDVEFQQEGPRGAVSPILFQFMEGCAELGRASGE